MEEQAIQLPPLPEGRYTDFEAFNADQMQAYARAAVLAERERCAKVCESMQIAKVATLGDWTKLIGDEIAAAIRKG
jgi:hypothetical protein